MIVHKKITIIGRVQGVGFRYTAKSVAQYLDIKGTVKNTPGNEVYIEAEGEEFQIKEFIKWCQQGPPHARVDNVVVYDGEVSNFTTFDITR
jgi:acylphosphatase